MHDVVTLDSESQATKNHRLKGLGVRQEEAGRGVSIVGGLRNTEWQLPELRTQIENPFFTQTRPQISTRLRRSGTFCVLGPAYKSKNAISKLTRRVVIFQCVTRNRNFKKRERGKELHQLRLAVDPIVAGRSVDGALAELRCQLIDDFVDLMFA